MGAMCSSEKTLIIDAVRDRDIEALNALLAQGIDVNQKDEVSFSDPPTPMHINRV